MAEVARKRQRLSRRKPLEWYDDGRGGRYPGCTDCFERLVAPMFVEAVYSVSIEHPGDPADLAKRVIDRYHANGHRDD
jgi:hypothetical protein